MIHRYPVRECTEGSHFSLVSDQVECSGDDRGKYTPVLGDNVIGDLESGVVLSKVHGQDHGGTEVHEYPEKDVHLLSSAPLSVLDQEDSGSGEDHE